jgi:hypothetical protein
MLALGNASDHTLRSFFCPWREKEVPNEQFRADG